MKPTLILDFDSTIVSVESLDLLAEISLAKHPEREQRQQKIEELTKLGMEGKLDFRESLLQRIALLDANKSHLETLVKRLQKSISPSFVHGNGMTNVCVFRRDFDACWAVQ